MGESRPPHEPAADLAVAHSNPIKSIFGKIEPLHKFLGLMLAIFGVTAVLKNSGSSSHSCMIVVVNILSFAILFFLLSMQARFTQIAIAGVMIGSALLVVAFLIIASAFLPLPLLVIFIIALVVVIAFCFYANIKEEADVGEQDKIDKDGSAADSMV